MQEPSNETGPGAAPGTAKRLRIGVDFDGVLFDHIPYLLRGFRDAHGIDLEAEGLRHWDFFQYRAVREGNLTWNCVRNVLRAIETDPTVHRAPLRDPRAVPVLRALAEAGHEIHVVTARDPESRTVTADFLRRWSVPHRELRMGVAVKTGYDVLIDDAPHNVLTAAADGTLALLMDQPYNQDVPTRTNPLRVHDWSEVAQRLTVLA